MTFLRRLFDRAAPVSPAVETARTELHDLSRRQPALAGHALTLADALPIIWRDHEPTPAFSLSAERVTAKLAEGTPLLRGETLTFDVSALTRRWQELCDVLGQRLDKKCTHEMAQTVRRGDFHLQEMTNHVLSGRLDAVHARAESLGLEPALTGTVLRWALLPALTRIQEDLAPQTARWRHGYCPICGSWPALGEFRGLEQVRFLRCGLCAASWEFPRLRCPFCSTDDHRQLGYLHREGEEGKERVATCAACRGYIKMVATLSPLRGEQLLVMELATLPLDFVAGDRGFAAP